MFTKKRFAFERRPRTRVHFNLGNLLELAGASMLVTGVYIIAGLGVALLVGSVALIVGAEFIYTSSVMTIPLLHFPQPRRRFTDWRKQRRLEHK